MAGENVKEGGNLDPHKTASELYSQMAGEGFEGMSATQFAIPLLLIAQPTSEIVTSGEAEKLGIKTGDFYNSVTKRCYGNKINVVVAYFKVMWFEWKPKMGGLAGRHEPGSVRVKGDPYTGMTNTDTGNDIVETWLYFVVLKDFPEDGFLTYQSTRGNIQYLKPWNSAMHEIKLPPTERFPDGAPAPIFSQVWEIETMRNKNDKGTWFAFGTDKKPSFKNKGLTPPELFSRFVDPVRKIAPSAVSRVQVLLEDKSVVGPAEAERY